MNQQDKQAFVEDLQGKLSDATAVYLTDFTGMNVKQMTEFRSRLRREGVDYVVVKNTLAQRALANLELPDIASFFTGPTGLVIGQDSVKAAKVLSDFAKQFDNKPAVKLGVVQNQQISADQIKVLAELPPRDELLAKLAGGLQAPMARLAGGMQNILGGFANALDQLRQSREGSE